MAHANEMTAPSVADQQTPNSLLAAEFLSFISDYSGGRNAEREQQQALHRHLLIDGSNFYKKIEKNLSERDCASGADARLYFSRHRRRCHINEVSSLTLSRH